MFEMVVIATIMLFFRTDDRFTSREEVTGGRR